MSSRAGRQPVVAAGFGDSVLTDLVEKRLVADFQQSGSLLAIPVGLLERLRDGRGFSFILRTTRERFQTACRGLSRSAPRGRVRVGSAIYIVFRVQFGDRQGFVPQDQVAFYEIAQLAQVARPRVLQAGR